MQADTNVVLSKLLAALGLNEARKAILDTLDNIAPALMGSIGDAIKKRNWTVLRRLLTKLLQLMVLKRFRDALAARVGERTAAKIVGKVAARFIPVLGWAVLIGSVIWAFAEECYESP